jgi:uncharacterized membrane protein YbhN (UPF0104 family)
MGRVVGIFRSRKVRIGVNAAFVTVALTVTALTIRHVANSGWPLHHADPVLVAVAAVLFILGYAFKAIGWQYLFPPEQRPSSMNLAAAGGAASVGGIALPGRFDEAIRIAVVRKAPGRSVGLGVIGLSLIVLGWIDSAALTPLATVSAVSSEKAGVQIGFAALAAIGVIAAGAVIALPLLARTWLRRFKLSLWVNEHCACPREASKAWLCVTVSWGLRGTAVFVLLHGLAVGASFPLALAFLCASAASAALPIAPAGAATQAGAGAAILAAAGVSTPKAIAFAVAAQALVILAGAVCIVAAAGWHAAMRLKPRLSTA